MAITFIDNQVYTSLNYTEVPLGTAEYNECTFDHCIFYQSDLRERKFENCAFFDCDLSMANLQKTVFREVSFKRCKLLGLRFDECNPFLLSFSFQQCQLDYSSFAQLKLKNTHFKNCQLNEVEFIGCDLSNMVFEDCDLLNAVFENTILENADFSTAYNYRIDPENNRLFKAKFSVQGLPGLLEKYKIVAV